MRELLTIDTLAGLAVTAGFAGAAWGLRGVTGSGALAGAVLAFSIYLGSGFGGFVVLVTVFVITWASTRLGYARKLCLGMAESRRGRSAVQVAANVAAAAAFCVAAMVGYRELLLAAAMAALSEAAADTASSECGEALSARAYLITTMKPVPVGSDGAISLPGTLAAVVACVLVPTVAAATQVIGEHAIARVAVAALAGTLLDSLLGATLEQRRIVGNNTVNFISTAFAGALAMALLLLRL